jgi:hypothetical protein
MTIPTESNGTLSKFYFKFIICYFLYLRVLKPEPRDSVWRSSRARDESFNVG